MKYVFIGLVVYTVLVTAFAVYHNIWFKDLGVGWLQKGDGPSDFAVSFHASAMESILFFVCSGGIALFLSISRPEYENFDTKLSYLFPRVNQSEKGKDYCRASINKLACISTKTTIQVSVDEYSHQFSAFKLSADHEYHLLNLHNNINFKDTLQVKHKLDDAQPTSFGNHCWGQIKKIRTISNHKVPDESKNYIDRPIALTKQNQSFPFEVEIKPNDNMILDISSWTWNKFETPQNSRVGRFTEHLLVKVTNNLDQPIILIKHDTEDSENTLESGESLVIYDAIATPNDLISYTVRLKS